MSMIERSNSTRVRLRPSCFILMPAIAIPDDQRPTVADSALDCNRRVLFHWPYRRLPTAASKRLQPNRVVFCRRRLAFNFHAAFRPTRCHQRGTRNPRRPDLAPISARSTNDHAVKGYPMYWDWAVIREKAYLHELPGRLTRQGRRAFSAYGTHSRTSRRPFSKGCVGYRYWQKGVFDQVPNRLELVKLA